MVNAIQTALSGLTAATKRLSTSASNIANINTSGSLTDPENAPYAAQTTVQTAKNNGNGVESVSVPKNTPFVPAFDADSPFADENGLVGVPNVNLAEEAVQQNIAKYEYKANLNVLKTISEMEDELQKLFDRDV